MAFRFGLKLATRFRQGLRTFDCERSFGRPAWGGTGRHERCFNEQGRIFKWLIGRLTDQCHGRRNYGLKKKYKQKNIPTTLMIY